MAKLKTGPGIGTCSPGGGEAQAVLPLPFYGGESIFLASGSFLCLGLWFALTFELKAVKGSPVTLFIYYPPPRLAVLNWVPGGKISMSWPAAVAKMLLGHNSPNTTLSATLSDTECVSSLPAGWLSCHRLPNASVWGVAPSGREPSPPTPGL